MGQTLINYDAGFLSAQGRRTEVVPMDQIDVEDIPYPLFGKEIVYLDPNDFGSLGVLFVSFRSIGISRRTSERDDTEILMVKVEMLELRPLRTSPGFLNLGLFQAICCDKGMYCVLGSSRSDMVSTKLDVDGVVNPYISKAVAEPPFFGEQSKAADVHHMFDEMPNRKGIVYEQGKRCNHVWLDARWRYLNKDEFLYAEIGLERSVVMGKKVTRWVFANEQQVVKVEDGLIDVWLTAKWALIMEFRGKECCIHALIVIMTSLIESQILTRVKLGLWLHFFGKENAKGFRQRGSICSCDVICMWPGICMRFIVVYLSKELGGGFISGPVYSAVNRCRFMLNEYHDVQSSIVERKIGLVLAAIMSTRDTCGVSVLAWIIHGWECVNDGAILKGLRLNSCSGGLKTTCVNGILQVVVDQIREVEDWFAECAHHGEETGHMSGGRKVKMNARLVLHDDEACANEDGS